METMAQKAESSREASTRYAIRDAERAIDEWRNRVMQLERIVAELAARVGDSR